MNGRMESRETRAAQRRGKNGKMYLQPFTYARAHMREFFEREPPVLPEGLWCKGAKRFSSSRSSSHCLRRKCRLQSREVGEAVTHPDPYGIEPTEGGVNPIIFRLKFTPTESTRSKRPIAAHPADMLLPWPA